MLLDETEQLWGRRTSELRDHPLECVVGHVSSSGLSCTRRGELERQVAIGQADNAVLSANLQQLGAKLVASEASERALRAELAALKAP